MSTITLEIKTGDLVRKNYVSNKRRGELFIVLDVVCYTCSIIIVKVLAHDGVRNCSYGLLKKVL
jgi:hypothetical protein